ncbi:MAG: SpaA isopeptide-forming pilin-related protein, partial [Anaerorhabdus sp.]|uniref:MSCRAMM family protein n=1 Tax=Anaerorhabdus sp. TaxID=1872524 RepID=UPI002FC831B8
YDQLLPQTVYIKETAVPNHLVLDSTIRSIQVIANSTVSFTATNNWVKGKVKIRKTDSESGKQVAGATYAIFNESNQEIQRFVTNRNGYTESGYLRFGNYYVKEVIAPTGYLINETKYPFTISTNEQKIDITGTDTRVKGKISLEKQDQETGAVAQGDATLDGAVYGLYAKDNILDPADYNVLYPAGQLITSMTTKDRKATFDNLYLGSYFVKEITPPAGYLLDTKEYPITLSYKNQNTALIRVDRVVKDDVIKGDLEIQKTVDAKIIKSRKIDFNKRNTRSALKDPGVGFKFDVTHDKSGTLVGTMTTDENGFAEMKDLPYGWYTITEQKTEGYDTLAPFKVFVSTDKKVYKFAIENTALRAYVKLVKKDADTGKTVPLAGYKFKIKDKNGNYVKQHLVYPTQMDIDTFVTAADGSCTLPEKLIYGTYYLEEVAVEGDYVRNPNPVEFKVDGTIATVVVEMPNKAVYGRINLIKSDYDTKETLSGVTYQLTANDTIYTKGYEVDAEGNRLIAYKKGDAVSIDISEDGYYVTDEKGEIHINNLPLGKYAIKETKNLDGYIIDEKTYEFELKYQDDATEVIVKDLEYTNKLTQIEFEKMDMENEKHIKGAELKVLDAAGNVIDAWTTSDDIHIIRGLIVGQTYTLREDYAPKGYMIAKDKVFTVENEKTQRVIMNDPMVQILKVDASNNKEIPEATLQIISTKTKQIVDQWVTTDVPYNPSGLIEGEDYILHELEAPKGYVVAKDVPFTTTNGMNQKIIMSDPKMEISKVDANDKKAVVGAKLQVISKATDEVVDEWITTDTAYNPSGLVVENEYILREVEAPKGYIVAKDVPFTTTSEPVQKITMSDPQLEVNKVDSLNGKAISGATLQIISTKTKQIVDQWVTTEEIYNPSGLIEGEDYILHELEAPKGYIVAKDIPFTTTNEPVQKIVMSDPKMEISKVDANDKKAVVGAK